MHDLYRSQLRSDEPHAQEIDRKKQRKLPRNASLASFHCSLFPAALSHQQRLD